MKHSEVIFGKDFTAILCEIPDKCEHDDKGEIMICINNEWIPQLKLFPVWMDSEQRRIFSEKNDWSITGESVSCSKCGKMFSPFY